MQNVLITGGTGLIGRQLSAALTELNYEVRILTRNSDLSKKPNHYLWNLDDEVIDENAFENLDYIIHLAGTNVASGRWTKSRKKSILLVITDLKPLNMYMKNQKKEEPIF